MTTAQEDLPPPDSSPTNVVAFPSQAPPPPRVVATGPRTMDLPSATLAAGKGTTLSFHLADPSFLKRLNWAPGFRIAGIRIDKKDFGEGDRLVDGRLFSEHRVLTSERLQIDIVNTTDEDREFSGTMTLDVSPVIASRDHSCSLGGET